jgi:hypothetical protein
MVKIAVSLVARAISVKIQRIPDIIVSPGELWIISVGSGQYIRN